MKRLFSALICLAVVLAIILSCASCDRGGEPSSPTPENSEPPRFAGSITVGVPESYPDEIMHSFTKYVEAFSAEYPGVEIDLRRVTTAEDALRAAKEDRNYADVVLFPGRETLRLTYDEDLLLPLDIIYEDVDTKNIYRASLEAGMLAGKTYSVAVNYDPVCMIYNKTAFEELLPGRKLPKTWTVEEMAAYCLDLIEAQNGQPTTLYYGAELDITYEPVFLSLLRPRSEYRASKGSKGWVDYSSMALGFSRFEESPSGILVENHYAITADIEAVGDEYPHCVFGPGREFLENPDNWGKSLYTGFVADWIKETFLSGEPVFRAVLFSELPEAVRQYEEKGVEWDFAPFPGTSYTGYDSCVAADCDCLGVRKDIGGTENATAAVYFCGFMYSDKGQAAFSEGRRPIPPLKSMAEGGSWRSVGGKYADKKWDLCLLYAEDSVPAFLSYYVPGVCADVITNKINRACFESLRGYGAKGRLSEIKDAALVAWYRAYGED